MRKKVLFLLAFAVICTLLVATLAVSVMAEDTIQITYNHHSGEVRETVKPNADGSYTLRSNKFSNNGTVTLSNETVVDKEFYGWYDEEGNVYAPGATVTFTKSARLYEAYGVTVYNAADLKKLIHVCYVKLGCDITAAETLGDWWMANCVNLNGYTLTSTAQTVISVQRGSIVIHGPGKIIHQPTSISKDANACALTTRHHGYGDTAYPQQIWIGKGVELTTPYSAYCNNGVCLDKTPKIVIAGTVNARTLVRINSVPIESTCYIAESAVINVSENFLEFSNTSGVTKYMDLTLNGTVNVANGTGTILTDFVREKVGIVVNGGKFCVAQSDLENIKYYLPDTLMPTVKTEGELTWTEFVESDCVHNWVKDVENSVEPTPSTLGTDVLNCSLCGTSKTVVTAYNPSNADVTITVRDENGVETDVVVKIGDVFDIVITGVAEKTKYSFVGVKGNEMYPAETIVAIEIPYGLGVVNVTNTNETLETIKFADGASACVNSLVGFKALKTIEIGAATVEFISNGGNTSLETIKSEVAGASVTFSKSCFDGRANVKYLIMANGSTYKFGENSFRLTGIETVIFPDEATIEFIGGAAFYNAAVKYAYFGKSIKEIKNKPLDCALNLEAIVIMSATYVDQYCFCVDNASKSTSVVKVYCHSENISFNQNAFINRTSQGVELYTIDPDIKSISGCKYTVYNGIPHAYAEGIVKAPTCISTGIAGSTTDCVCGVNEIVTYTVYTAEGSEEFSTAQREIPIVDIHVLSTDLMYINYKNGYLDVGTKEYLCALCRVAIVEEEAPSAAAMFECLGYSASETDGGIVLGYKVNRGAVDEFKSLPNVSITFGLFAVSQNMLGDSNIFDENGKINANVLSANTERTGFDYFDLKLTGYTTEAQKNAKVAIGTYIIVTKDGKKIISYAQSQEPTEGAKYYFASYNEMIALTK